MRRVLYIQFADSLWSMPYGCVLGIFFIFNTFCKLILNLMLFIFFLKLILLAAPIVMTRRNACAAPCMVARQGADVAMTRKADG